MANPSEDRGSLPVTPDPIDVGDAGLTRNFVARSFDERNIGVVGALALAGILLVACSGQATPSAPDVTAAGSMPTSAHPLSPEAVMLIQNFDSNRQTYLNNIKALLQKDGWDLNYYQIYIGRSIEAASPSMSPQAILDRDAAKENDLTSNPNHPQALAQVEMAAQPASRAYSMLSSRITDPNAVEASSDENKVISSKYFENGTFLDPKTGNSVVSAENTPTMIIGNMSERYRTNAVAVFQFDRSADGKVGDWRLVNSADGKNVDFGWIDPMHVDQVQIVPNHK